MYLHSRKTYQENFIMNVLLNFIVILSMHQISASTLGNSSSIRKINKTSSEILDHKIIPKLYHLILKLEHDWYETNAFKGTLRITVEVKDASNREIIIHSKDLQVDKVKVDENEASFTYDTESETITITAPEDLLDGTILHFEYSGILSLTDMHGFYKSSYEDEEGKLQYLASTQFEATHARRAFPCFDQPDLKAVFNLQFIYPNEYNVIANTPIESSQAIDNDFLNSVFKETPSMSTYLIAFVVSKFECEAGVSLHGNIPYEVCSRPEAKATREFAVDVGPHLMRVLEKYTDRKYEESGIGKMTQIAVPDFSAGAMENWGLVTYRETGLLWHEEESSNIYKQRLASVISHEFAHMWFGNLVTMKRWDDLFLNEGFARYFQYFGTNQVFPCWALDKQFIIEQVHSALLVDSKISSMALSSPVSTPSEISERFDTISYSKGASIFRMVINFMGEKQFQQGIRTYLKPYTNTDHNDLWTALNGFANTLPDGRTLNNIMENWTTKPGYPILYVGLSGNTVTVSQKRFLISGEDTENTKWYVPVSFTVASSEEKFQTTATTLKWILPDAEISNLVEISNDRTEWIILNNNQEGYYRVKYDDALLNRIYSGLVKENFDGIDVISRTQFIDDAFNFARIGELSYSIVFRLLSFLQRDVEYYSWYAAFQGLSYTLSKLGSENFRNAMKNHISTEMEVLLKSAPLIEENYDDQIYTLKHEMVNKWACKLGNDDCITAAKKIFADYRNSTHSVKPTKNLRHIVYCTALQHSDDIEGDWDFLWEKYMETKLSTEQVTILNNLGCTKNMTALNRYLDNIIDNKVRIQDNKIIFSSIYNNNLWGISIALDFYTVNYARIVDYYGIKYANSLLGTFAEMISTDADLQKVNDLLKIENIDGSTKTAIEEAIATASRNLQVVEDVENDLADFFFQARGSGIEVKGNLSVVFVFIALILTACSANNLFKNVNL